MIAANGWCYIKIQVVGTSSGITENHTGPVTSTNAQPGIDASATLNVDSAGGTTPQTISFLSTPPGAAKVGDPAYVAVATASSGLPVVLTIDGSSATVCAIDDGSVRFAVEDLLAAGSIIDALATAGIDFVSPEGAAACAAFTGLHRAIAHLATASSSGNELTALGRGDEIAPAMLLDVDTEVSSAPRVP